MMLAVTALLATAAQSGSGGVVSAKAAAGVDRTPPFLKHANRTKRAYYPATGWNLWSIRLSGGDLGGSGLNLVQFWFSTYNRPTKAPVGGRPGFVAVFGPEIGVVGKYPPVWVRASDKAGNWSRWYRVL